MSTEHVRSHTHTRGRSTGSPCCSSSSTDLLLPVVRQGQVVVPAACLLIVVHECVQVWKVAVQVNVSGVPSPHQVAIELWTLLSRRQNSFQISAACGLRCFIPAEWVNNCASWDLQSGCRGVMNSNYLEAEKKKLLHKLHRHSAALLFSNMCFSLLDIMISLFS